MTPPDLFYSWQALLVAVACVSLSRFVTAVVYAVFDKERLRNSRPARIALHAIPVLIGFLFAALVPLRPEGLIEYVEAHAASRWIEQAVVYGSWGAACGQFSAYMYDRVKEITQQTTKRG